MICKAVLLILCLQVRNTSSLKLLIKLGKIAENQNNILYNRTVSTQLFRYVKCLSELLKCRGCSAVHRECTLVCFENLQNLRIYIIYI